MLPEFDPEFFHTSSQQHKAAAERLIATKAEGGAPLPIVGPPPSAHPYFVPARGLLYHPTLLAILRSALARSALHRGTDYTRTLPAAALEALMAAAAVPTEGTEETEAGRACTFDGSDLMLLRALQLLTLQVHCIDTLSERERRDHFASLCAVAAPRAPRATATGGATPSSALASAGAPVGAFPPPLALPPAAAPAAPRPSNSSEVADAPHASPLTSPLASPGPSPALAPGDALGGALGGAFGSVLMLLRSLKDKEGTAGRACSWLVEQLSALDPSCCALLEVKPSLSPICTHQCTRSTPHLRTCG